MPAPQLRWNSFLIKEFNNIKSSLRFHGHACLLLLQDQLKYFILLYYKIKRYSIINLQRIFSFHTSYLSMLVHRRIIKACKKNAKKRVNLLQNSQIWSKLCGLLAKKKPAQKKYITTSCVVVTIMSYAWVIHENRVANVCLWFILIICQLWPGTNL